MAQDLLAGLDSEARVVVSSWLDDLRYRDSHPAIQRAIARSIVATLSKYRRATRPDRILLGWAIDKIEHGYSVEDLISGGGHEGGYFVSIGVGRHGLLEKTLRPDEVGVHIRGRGVHVEKLRDLYRRAEAERTRRRARQSSLFA